LSYLLESEGQAAMVDPGRHIDYYRDYLKKNQLSLKWIFDTHLHADHISGAAALIKVTGATYYANVFDMNGSKLSYQPLCDGQYCVLGDTDIKATSLKTPGHTSGSTIIIFADAVLFTGDTLFLSSLGRPDLGGHAREWAEDLWNSVRALDRLDGDLMVLPTHTRGLAEYDENWRVFATLDSLRKNNPLLTIENKDVFIEKVLAHLPLEPDSYQKMRTVNMGLTDPSEEERDELELGRNRCAIEQANEDQAKNSQ
jgi:glyoxylase-like metal-dependent hydrolase (beta-lactamase superfamily II)